MFFVIMTAYNEEEPLDSVLDAMPETSNGHRLQVLVVDDGSTDRTADVATGHGCTVIRFDENRGKGAALKAAISAVPTADATGVVLMDADGQHDPSSLDAVTGPIAHCEADMVVGSRYLGRTGRGATPWNRYLVRTGTVAAMHRLLGLQVTDPYCGFRAFTPAALRAVRLCGDRYESELEMLFCAARAGLRVTEVPIPKIYGDATSKMGARRGAILGRTEVVYGYARTILSEVRKGRMPQTMVPEPHNEDALVL